MRKKPEIEVDRLVEIILSDNERGKREVWSNIFAGFLGISLMGFSVAINPAITVIGCNLDLECIAELVATYQFWIRAIIPFAIGLAVAVNAAGKLAEISNR